MRSYPICINFIGAKMISAKQLADFGYKTFSSSMLLLTLYGGYLLSNGVYRAYQRNTQLKEQGINADDTKHYGPNPISSANYTDWVSDDDDDDDDDDEK
ncbi:hypothetical protein L345_12387, partial [Ophiophagus hannah]